MAQIREVTEEKVIKEFTNHHVETQVQHSLEWKEIVEKTYKNCHPHYYIKEESNKITALFPFFLIRSKLFGNRIISIPFLDTGGFIGKYDEANIKEVMRQLNRNIQKIKHIEIRLDERSIDFTKIRQILLKNSFKEDCSKQQARISLTSKEEMWKKFHKHTRNDIRKAEKSGLKIKKIENKEELDQFYKLYLKEMHNFGTPQHAKKIFENLKNIMKEKFFGLNCYFNEKLIGSSIAIYFNKEGNILFNVSDKKYKQYHPNDLLYWETIQWATKNKVNYLNLGQVEKDTDQNSRAHGLYKFKLKWLSEVHPRHYFYYRFGEKQENKKESYKSFRKLWRFIPNPILKKVGVKICSELGI